MALQSVLFMGNEITDFPEIVNNVSNYDRGVYRGDDSSRGIIGFTRTAIALDNQPTYAPLNCSIYSPFDHASSNFWFSMRSAYNGGYVTDFNNAGKDDDCVSSMFPMLIFSNAGKKLFAFLNVGNILVLKTYKGADTLSNTGYEAKIKNGWRLVGMYKMDFQITLNGANSTVNVYQNNELILTYTGNLTNGATTIDGFRLCSQGNRNETCYYSEVFAMERDTRSMALRTHTPIADRPGNQWAGSYSDIDDADYRNESNVISTPTVDAVSQFDTTGLPTGSFRVRAVKVTGVFSRGDNGPGSVAVGVSARPSLSTESLYGKHRYWKTIVLATHQADGNLSTVLYNRVDYLGTIGGQSVLPADGNYSNYNSAEPNNIRCYNFRDSFGGYTDTAAPDANGQKYWVTIFPSPVAVAQIFWSTTYSGSALNTPRDVKVQYSDDGVTWTDAWSEFQIPFQGYCVTTSTALAYRPTFSPDIPVDTSLGKRFYIWESNPLSGQPWLDSEVNTMGVSVKARP